MHRPTMADVARAAGVSRSTVDRVLNGRLPVRRDKAEQVISAAASLGFHATGLLRQRLVPEPPERTLGFILQKPADHFHGLMGKEFVRATRETPSIRGEPIVEFVDGLDPQMVASRLRSVARRVDAVALIAADHPDVATAVNSVNREGKPVLAFISRLSSDELVGFVGQDNVKVGRTAGWALSRLCPLPGRVGISLGSHRLACQHEAEENCRSYLRAHCPHLEVVDSPTNFEQPRFAYENARDLLHRHPDLAGLFVAGGGLEGVMRAIKEEGAIGRLAAIGRELTPETRAGLMEGTLSMVISHPIQLLADRVVELLARA